MEALIKNQRQKTRLRKIDIARWGSEVANQHGIRRLPTWHLYDGTRLVSTDMLDIWRRLQAGTQ